MGERKGQNKYYPPDYDPKKGGLNKWQGTHALRERARKLHMGILIIRFEMPFNVWCEGCGNHVGMGVRYNAEKKKVDMYYTTPVYEFKMKCHLCSNYFIIRTDPKNFDYEMVEGLRRQEKRWDMATNEQIASTEREKSKKLATDAMFKLEHGELDIEKSKTLAPELNKLERFQYRLKDDFSRNQEMRRIFRTAKKETMAQTKKDNALLAKSSLSIKLVPENPDDVKLASLMTKYKTVQSSEEKQRDIIEHLDNEPIFGARPCSSTLSSSNFAPKAVITPPPSITDNLKRKKSLSARRLLENCVRKSVIKEKMSKLEQQTFNNALTTSSIISTSDPGPSTSKIPGPSTNTVSNNVIFPALISIAVKNRKIGEKTGEDSNNEAKNEEISSISGKTSILTTTLRNSDCSSNMNKISCTNGQKCFSTKRTVNNTNNSGLSLISQQYDSDLSSSTNEDD